METLNSLFAGEEVTELLEIPVHIQFVISVMTEEKTLEYMCSPHDDGIKS